MRSKLITLTAPALGLLAALALTAQPSAPGRRYRIVDLGPAGNPFSMANYVNSRGIVGGFDTVLDGGVPRSHAVLWYKGTVVDLKQLTDAHQPGILGPNSAAGVVSESGQVVIGGETFAPDPNNENFCGFGTGLQCVVFVSTNGVITRLPNPLGGTNSGWGGVNKRGELAGFAENTVRDPECLAHAPNGTGPQVLDYRAVVWGPKPGQFRQLKPLAGDTVGIAFGINDSGQAIGISGRCGNTVIPGFTAGPHAVLWDADGTPHDLGSFGGTSNPAILGVGNAAIAINNQGEIVGTSAPSGNLVNEPFFWTKEKGMQHLKLLSGDVVGAGLAINNHGVVVGASIGPGGAAAGSPSAVLWQNGPGGDVTDLNTFLTPDSPLGALLTAFGIDDAGDIAGFGVTTTGDIHGFLATLASVDRLQAGEPLETAPRRHVDLNDSARKRIGWRPLGGR